MKQKHLHHLEDANVRRWYQNVGRGSMLTANVYLRRLGGFCDSHRLTPQDLAGLTEKQAYDLLLDAVADLEKAKLAGSYIESILKSVKSWLSFNGVEVRRRIQIRGARDTPTLKDERVPTQEELRKIFLAADAKTRLACALVAHSGVRLEVLGNYNGLDGLSISDFPELSIADGKAEFKEIPTMIRVRSELSKKRNEYFTFLSAEGCEYLKNYIEMRMRSGEKMTGQSAIIRDKWNKRNFITTNNIGDGIRKAIRKAGFGWRPYVLRSYFATQMMLAESKGLVIRDYRAFFMGHKGDIEHTYTLNKRRLPEEVVKQMRECYRKAQTYLQTRETGKSEDDFTRMFKRQLLMVAGFAEADITDKQIELSDEDFHKLIRDKLTVQLANNGARQKVVPIGDVESYLKTGWEYVSTLPGDKAIMKLPESA